MKKYKVLVTYRDKYKGTINIAGEVVEYAEERAAEINKNLKKHGVVLEEVPKTPEELAEDAKQEALKAKELAEQAKTATK